MKHNFFIVGPTGSGKTSVALKVAQKTSGKIINVDSVQCYKGVEIGSAQPTLEEQTLVPHYLFGFVNPPEKLTAGKYQKLAFELLVNLNKQVKNKNESHKYFVGAAGFYFDALEYGMYQSPPIPTEIKKYVDDLVLTINGKLDLTNLVSQKDPKYALRIGKNDLYRNARALQVMLATGRTVTDIEADFKQNRKSRLQPKKYGILIHRETLKNRLHERLEIMLQKGLDDEVKKLLDQGLKDWWPLSSVGLKETVAYLENEITDSQRKELIVKNSMALAKRQMTWFKRDKTIEWFEDPQKLTEILIREGST